MITIDAQGKRLGRVASEAAAHLIGKTSVSFAKNKVADIKVTIINAGKAYIPAKKKNEKEYVWYTGFRGGLKSEKLGDLIDRKGVSEAFIEAIDGMLPKNSLRSKRMKNLTVKE